MCSAYFGQDNDLTKVIKPGVTLEKLADGFEFTEGPTADINGNLWSCADEKNELWKITPDKKAETIISKFGGKLLNGPNDLWITPDGGIYFTDPFYKRTCWDHSDMPQEKQCVYYLRPDYKTLIRVTEDLQQPNGIVGTPDSRMLFVADIRGIKHGHIQ